MRGRVGGGGGGGDWTTGELAASVMTCAGSYPSRSDPWAGWPRLVVEELQRPKPRSQRSFSSHGFRAGPPVPKLPVPGTELSALRIQFTPRQGLR